MKIKVQKKYLDTVFSIEVEGKDLKEALLKASIFTQRDVCLKCQNENISLEGSKTQEGHIYIKRRCTNEDCTATSTLGTYRDGTGHFWKGWEIFQPS